MIRGFLFSIFFYFLSAALEGADSEAPKLPRAFTGYRLWTQHKAKILFRYNESDRNPDTVFVTLECPGAQEFKISNRPDFKGARWRKFKKELPWSLETSKPIPTVYAAFKRQNNETGQFEVTFPVHYSLHKKALYKKIEKFEKAYMDWTEGKIFLEVESSVHGQDSRYAIGKAQMLAEQELKRQAYETLKNLPLNFFYRIKDYLKLNQSLYGLVNQSIDQMKLIEINYPDPHSAQIKGEIAFSSSQGAELALRLKEYKEQTEVNVVKKYEKIYRDLVIDVRNMDMVLCLFPVLITESGKEVLNAKKHTQGHQLFVKYLRSQKDYPWKSTSPERLYIRALSVKNEERSKIVISDRYAELLHSNLETYSNFVNGGLHVLVD